MKCPVCGHEAPPNARFCNQCGAALPKPAPVEGPESVADAALTAETVQEPGEPPVPPVAPPQPAHAVPENNARLFYQPKQRRWKPWMTVTAICVGVAALLTAACFLIVPRIGDMLGSTGLFDHHSQTETTYRAPEQLLRTWTQSARDYYGTQYLLKMTFTEDTVSLTGQTGAEEEDYGTYRYYMIDEDEIYLPELRAMYEFELNDNGNMLTVEPGIVTGSEKEYWFNFEF